MMKDGVNLNTYVSVFDNENDKQYSSIDKLLLLVKFAEKGEEKKNSRTYGKIQQLRSPLCSFFKYFFSSLTYNLQVLSKSLSEGKQAPAQFLNI